MQLLKLPSAMLRRSVPSRREEVKPSQTPGSRGSLSPGPMTSMLTTSTVSSATPTGASSRATLLGNGSHSSASVCRKHMLLEHSSAEHSEQLREAYVLDEQVIGRGGFGTVSRATLKTCPAVVRAVKAVPRKNLKAEDLVHREVAALRRLDHPSICKLFETFEDDKTMYLVLEFIDGRELFDEIVESGHLDEKQAAFIMQQVFNALRYCHERAVIHRDLKPDNIMLVKTSQAAAPARKRPAGPEVKLIDFGLAVITSKVRRLRSGNSLVGTADYMAPEARAGDCVRSSDLWSVGMVLHALLVGGLPPPHVQDGQAAIDFDKPLYASVSLQAKDLLRGLLQADPSERFSAYAAALHPWTQGGLGTALRPGDIAPTMAAFASFHRSAKLRRAALTALAMQLTSRQLEGLREQFFLIDTDGNGRISKEELVRSIAVGAPAGGVEGVRDWVESVFDSIDTDGSQEIEYTEWLAAALHEGAYRSEEALRAAFRVFDTDGDGGIDQRELGRVLSQTPEEIASAMPQFDANGDGVIDFEAFKAIFDTLLSPGEDAGAGFSTSILSL